MISRIDGVLVTPLARIADERGTILHMLRADDPHFIGFGEIYFSTVHPGAIKGWHIHREMTLNYAVPSVGSSSSSTTTDLDPRVEVSLKST